jgi:predicted O-methyltransferase YrrM
VRQRLKASLRGVVPRSLWVKLSELKRTLVRAALRHSVLKYGWISAYFDAWELNAYGLGVTLATDYYSPMPDLRRLQRNRDRWSKPSDLAGLRIDLPQMKNLWNEVTAAYRKEFDSLPNYDQLRQESYGEGYTPLDGMALYLLLRQHRPQCYVEVGAGMSTYYASCAALRNAAEGRPMTITCIEPFPRRKLRSMTAVALIEKEVQDVERSLFEALGTGDVLFIDSTHSLKIDGDVAYIFLEILPRLNKGVIVHVHDIPFPFNTPFPAETWVFGRPWPVFWTEAMLLQAFLCHNREFQIRLSLPLLRFWDEEFLRQTVVAYEQLKGTGMDTFSSIWLERI